MHWPTSRRSVHSVFQVFAKEEMAMGFERKPLMARASFQKATDHIMDIVGILTHPTFKTIVLVYL